MNQIPRVWTMLGFCLFSRGDDDPRRSNQVGEDDCFKLEETNLVECGLLNL